MKNKKLSIRISDADWQRFHDKAEQADMTLTEYITDCCLGNWTSISSGCIPFDVLFFVGFAH